MHLVDKKRLVKGLEFLSLGFKVDKLRSSNLPTDEHHGSLTLRMS